ncbi:MAG TPA: bifunctional pyr operon transcriptional regulator/uracil phosphoribosyltransferase PyrR [Candidatus Omnitrophota bacterium]|nr:bifunctional pyr operon transcriptional regulator/uracil phosphoribosyltransferase PyrR [Candidatus Omnitrophota bacterium]HRK62463.1 bifunctional pyr operon transcriptional regulator/uracil phosphoribosyltransferase PyrR [Candidatus Omnitrophota bacterium]
MPKTFLDSTEIQRAVVRIAHEILERNHDVNNLAIVGVRTRGVFIAERIRNKIQEIKSFQLPFGILDITLYRDDLSEVGVHPQLKETDIPFDLHDRTIVLVDDVLFTGRTIRAALNAISDFGRPRAVQLAVLVDRGHRELPIKADFVGKNIPTSRQEKVLIHLQETDGKDEALILPVAGEVIS